MSTIVTRAGKGSALTFAEADANFTNLNTDKLENITSESIGDLSDVDTTGVANGNVLAYNSTSGNFEPSSAAGGIALTDLSVGAEGAATGDGDLSYDNTTGVFTYSPPTATGIGALANVVEDTTPQLGGNLDAQSTHKVVNLVDPVDAQDAATKAYVDSEVASATVTSATNTIVEVRNTTGATIAKGVPVYISGHSGSKILVAPADADDATKMPAIGLMGATTANNTDGEVVAFGNFSGVDTSTFSVGDTLFVDTTPGGTTFGGLTNTAPTGETAAIQNIGKVARSDGSVGEIIVSGPGRSNATPNLDDDQFFLGNASNQSVATDFSTATRGKVSVTVAAPGTNNLSYDSGTGVFTFTPTDLSAVGTLQNIVEDTTPQLGGDLDGQGNKVENVELDDYKETIYTGGTTTGTITPDVANGNIQSITLTGSITFNAFANAETGQSMTLIITQPSSGGPYTLTSTMKFASGNKTLSTGANEIDIMTVFYDGTTYYASLATGFA